MSVLCILQARVSSTRLPGKVLKPILGEPMLARQIERIARAERVDALTVATSDQASDDGVAGLCERLGVDCYRGSLDDVLDRFYQAARRSGPTHVMRLTGDCPLTDPAILDALVSCTSRVISTTARTSRSVPTLTDSTRKSFDTTCSPKPGGKRPPRTNAST